ncbi:MAG TPA: hypothetical protein VFQ38_22345 [Longimicrobiales bacterium]|nr:hypothetical protein [Longimicrobiales bacterium]
MSPNLRAGDLVEVRSEAEILASLDENGCIDGLPFMPEMLEYCGARVRVDKRADKTCDTIDYTGNRRMRDAVHLEGMRCSGAAHGGCQAHCPFFWKEAWLKPVDDRAGAPARPRRAAPDRPRAAGPAPAPAQPRWDRARLMAATQRPGPDGEAIRYRCQATELLAATTPMAWWDVRQYVRDVRSGNVGVMDVVRAASFRLFRRLIHARWFRGYRLALRAYDRFQSWRGGPPYPLTAGTLARTPRQTLDLLPGELVRVKPLDAIRRTVDGRGRNRGLSFDPEMVRYCGSERPVLARVERLIDERTGAMVHLSSDCIILDGAVCRATCSHKRLFCPRQLYPFWREIWLERVERPAGDVEPAPRAREAEPTAV